MHFVLQFLSFLTGLLSDGDSPDFQSVSFTQFSFLSFFTRFSFLSFISFPGWLVELAAVLYVPVSHSLQPHMYNGVFMGSFSLYFYSEFTGILIDSQ